MILSVQFVAGLLVFAIAGAAGPGLRDEGLPIRPPVEIPRSGALPYVVSPEHVASIEEIAAISASTEIRTPLRQIKRRHLGRRRDPATRRIGLDAIRDQTGAATLFAMPFVFDGERIDVQRATIDRLASAGDVGAAALLWTAVHHPALRWRRAALEATARPLGASPLAVLESAFRDSRHEIVTRAALATGALEVRRMLPHLIATQYTTDVVREQGDLAWIAIGTQRSYVRNLVPVVGDGSGAFQPVPGILTEGFVMRVTDAVAIVYRTEVHRVLVGLSSKCSGEDTSANGWSLERWRAWYNGVELPALLAEAAALERAARARSFAERERARRSKASEGAPGD